MIVNFQHPVGNVVPGEAGLDRDPSVAPHPPGPFKVGEKRAQPPADRMGVRMNLEAINLVPDKFIRTAILAHHHRLAGTAGPRAPQFQMARCGLARTRHHKLCRAQAVHDHS